MSDPEQQQVPGPFGWVSRLTRWASYDRTVRGQMGPLPPPPARGKDATADDLYSLGDGWLAGTVGAALSSFFSEPRTRRELYFLFEKMDLTDTAGAVLDIYADDATQPDPESGHVVWIECEDPRMQEQGDALNERLALEEDATPLARDVAKYGDLWERAVYRPGPDGGLRRLIPVPPTEMTRHEDKDGKLLGYRQAAKKFRDGKAEMSYPWDYVHFRLRGKDRRYPYGTSILHTGIRPWKQSIILEDWMMGYTINKHPDRNLIFLDTGTASEVEQAEIGRKFNRKLKRHLLLDPAGVSGKNINYRADPTTPMEDLLITVRTGSNTRIERMHGSANAADITPLESAYDRFYAAVRVPRAFFGHKQEPTAGQPITMKARLTNQDIRYAHSVRRLQRAVRAGITYAHELNFTLLMGLDPEDRTYDFTMEKHGFNVLMGPISYLEEQEQLEVEQLRQQVALAVYEMGVNNPSIRIAELTAYILREIMKAPDKVVQAVMRSQEEVEEREMLMAQAQAGGAPGAPGGNGDAEKHKRAAAGAKPPVKRESLIPVPYPAKGEGTPGSPKRQDLVKLSEAITHSRDLRRAINAGVRLWSQGDEEPLVTAMGALPTRAAAESCLVDAVTQEDLEDMLRESVEEVARAGS